MDIQTAKLVIKAATQADDTVLMEGKHGIGKSEVVVQFAKEENYHLETLFLSQQDIGDLIGIPHKVETETAVLTTWSVPIWMQRIYEAAEKGIPSIVFLDELNRAPIDVRQSSLQLVLERKMHEHCLPIVNGLRTMIVSAINPPDDYQVDELDPALLDRFLCITVEADLKAWLEYANKTNVSQVVRDFLTEYPDRLHWTPADGGAGTTPRSWCKFSNYMNNADNIPEEILFQVMKGKLGTEIGSQFYTFFKNYVDVLKMEDIEAIVEEHKDSVKTIEELSEYIREVNSKTEAIQKTEMTKQLAKKYMPLDDILPLLAYLYSLDVEICVAFLKGFRNDSPEDFKKLAQIDNKLNDKKLFKRIVQASDQE